MNSKKSLLPIFLFLIILIEVNAITIINVNMDNSQSLDNNITVSNHNFLQLSCTETWSCTEWSTCVASIQTRTCTDTHYCGTTINKPIESQSCTVETGGSDTGHGSSSSGTPICQEGIIDYKCKCNKIIYLDGYCINNTYYSEDPTIIEEDEEVIESDIEYGYSFTIISEKYAYEKKENFVIIVRTKKDDISIYASMVTVTIKDKDGNIIEEKVLEKTKEVGKYLLEYDNTLDEGRYTFTFKTRFGSIVIEQDKKILISLRPALPNVIRKSTGEIKPIIYWVIGTIFIIILILSIVIIRKKSQKQK